MKFENQALLAQRELRDLGFYKGALDGLWGVRSQLAVDAWVASEAAAAVPPTADTQFDPRTELNILTLCPAAQFAARKFMAAIVPAMAVHGVVPKITSGYRTYSEQNALYAQGRSKPGPVVTNAPAGYSNHNFKLAWDITLFDAKGKPIWDSPLYEVCAKIGEEQGLDCGAHWQSLKDEPHYQLKTGLSLAQMRERVANGQSIV